MSMIVTGFAAGLRVPNPGPMTQIQPFTYEDGLTFAEILYELKRYIQRTLVPYLNEVVGELDEKVAKLVNDVNAALDAQIAEVEEKLNAQDAENDQKILELTNYVNEQVQLIIEDSIQVQDPVMAGIMGDDESDTRGVTDLLYAPFSVKPTVDTLDETVQNGRLSTNSLIQGHVINSGINVKTFGAVGDGVADDTAAIKAAVVAVAASVFKRLVFPSGTYRITEEIFISSRMSLYGFGYSTVIDAREIPAGAAAIRFGGTTENVGSSIDGFDIMGKADHTTDGLYLGNRSGSVAVTDFSASNLRVRDFRVGIPGRFVWDADFSNVRVHLTNRPIEWGPQFNSVRFNGAFSSFSAACVMTNCETIHFDTLDVVNYTGEFHSFSLFQSHVIFTSPYIENIARFAGVGSGVEVVPSSMSISGGRVTGNVQVVKGVGLSITLPWVAERGVESDTRRLTVNTDSLLSGGLRRLRIDRDQNAPVGYKTLTRWLGDTAFPYTEAYGGSSITSTAKAGYYEVVSPAAGQGFLVSNAITVGAQYVLEYRIRKTVGTPPVIRNGALATAPMICTTQAGFDFETVYIPFIATETSIRILFDGACDVQYVSLTEGLVVRGYQR